MFYTQPDPRWMTIINTTQLPTVSTEITTSGMYKFNSSFTTEIIVSDTEISEFTTPMSLNAAIIIDGEDESYQYLRKGQFIKSDSSGGTFCLLG